jgi:hypothetical protein
MKRYIAVLGVLGSMALALAVSIMICAETADAIPAFARKYRMSCTTCHAPIPRLKEYGDEFAGNGFVLKDKEAKGYFVETGDKQLDLIREFPFAVRLEGFVAHRTETDRELDLSLPYNIKLLSGGSLTKNVAYYFYFYFSEHGEIAGLEDAYIMFNDFFGRDLDVYLGQFQVSDPLFKRELRLTYEDYQVYKSGVGESGVNVAYDRGIMITYALPSATDFVFELINGNGLDEADDFRVFDNDKYKNIVGRVSQGIGDYVRLGAFGYYGKEAREEGAGRRTNETWFLGPDATLSWQDKAELNFQYMERRDDNPFFWSTGPQDKVETRGGLTELIYWPEGDRSRWYAVGLYNWVDSQDDGVDYETITGHVGYVLRTNIRLIAENTYDIVNEENRFVIGFISAF